MQRPQITTVITIVATLVAVGVAWGDVKGKVDALKERQEEDRRDTKQAIHEVREHVKLIDANTQVILQKITVIETLQKAERRRE